MQDPMGKGELEHILSRLAPLSEPKSRLEQYTTPSAIAADILWDAHLRRLLSGARVLDLGCGNGILGIGAALLGAARADFVETDEDAARAARKNIEAIRAAHHPACRLTLHVRDALDWGRTADLVLMNPPFGTRKRGADAALLAHAFALAPRIYTFHKTATLPYILGIAQNAGFAAMRRWAFRFPLPATMAHHRKRIGRIDVTALYLEKQDIDPVWN